MPSLCNRRARPCPNYGNQVGATSRGAAVGRNLATSQKMQIVPLQTTINHSVVLEQHVTSLIEGGPGCLEDIQSAHALFMRVIAFPKTPWSSACGMYLAWAILAEGREGARSAFRRVMDLVKGGAPSLVPFILEFVKLEESHRDTDRSLVREGWEAAIRNAPTASDAKEILGSYADAEAKCGDEKNAAAIRWRAKALLG